MPSTLIPVLYLLWLWLLIVSTLFNGVSNRNCPLFRRRGELNGSLIIFSFFSVGWLEDLGLPLCPVLRESSEQISDTLTYIIV
jgi:hypothetical protein